MRGTEELKRMLIGELNIIIMYVKRGGAEEMKRGGGRDIVKWLASLPCRSEIED